MSTSHLLYQLSLIELLMLNTQVFVISRKSSCNDIIVMGGQLQAERKGKGKYYKWNNEKMSVAIL